MSALKRKPAAPLLAVSSVDINTAAGRPLFRDLHLTMGYEKVAIIGRNGVGKSHLMAVLAQEVSPVRGEVISPASCCFVPQDLSGADSQQRLESLFAGLNLSDKQLNHAFSSIGLPTYPALLKSSGLSNGELRKLHLLSAQLKQAELLLLDEPTEDLDQTGLHCLQHWIKQWPGGLLVVSHEPSLLQLFQQFLLVAESGCRYFAGDFSGLEAMLERESVSQQLKYLQQTHTLMKQEIQHEKIMQRRQQKKNQGRWRESGRMTPRTRLNSKRSYAQVSQGKVAKIRDERMNASRDLVRAMRRLLAVNLPMSLPSPQLPAHEGGNTLELKEVSAFIQGRQLFSGINLAVQRERIAITGPNGTGKTTLLNIMLKQRSADSGSVTAQLNKIGAINQGATNWLLDESLLEYLLMTSAIESMDSMAAWLVGHKFPLALAERPMASLSPGERVRAALICLMAKSPAVECLVLDEPTYALDFLGRAALIQGLKAWPGGLVVVSHDDAFLQAIGVGDCLRL